MSHPQSTGASQLTVFDAFLKPGKGHSFHKHTNQEEVMYIVAGDVEQGVDKDRRTLGPGDAAFIPRDMVHASFHIGQSDAKLVVIFGPCVGEGFEAVDVSGDVPWKGLRA